MKNNYTIVIIGENDFMTEDYRKEVTYFNTYRFEAIRKAEKCVSDIERLYKNVYIADVREWNDYTEPPMGM